MPWKEPQGGSRGRTGSPMISIRKSGSIGINASAMDKYFEDAENLKLTYDEENNNLGFTVDSDGLSLSENNSSGVLNPTSFLKEHRLMVDITTQYKPEVDDNPEWEDEDAEADKVVYIDLDNPLGTYGSRKTESDESSEDDSESDTSEPESSEEDSE